MSIRMTLSTTNLSAVSANFLAADTRLQRAAKRVVKRAGVKTHELAREQAPVDTGFMRSQLKLRFTEQALGYEVGFDEKDFEAAGLSFYPLFVLFGTVNQPANDFLFSAHEATKPQFKAELRKELQAAIRRKGAQ